MKAVENSKLVEAMNWRYAVKKFDPTRKISAADWETLEKVLTLSASSFGLQPWKFLVINDPAIRKQLTIAAWNQTQVGDCSHFVVLTSMTHMDEAHVARFIDSVAKTRSVPVESLAGYQKVVNGFVSKLPAESQLHWNHRQTYLALGNLMTAAAVMGIDTCPLEGLNAAEFDKILGIGKDYVTACAVALGYRNPEDKYANSAKVRFPKTEVIEYR